MNFQKPDTTTLLDVLVASWPIILLYGVVLAIGIVRMVRRPTRPTFSLSKRARRSEAPGASAGQESA